MLVNLELKKSTLSTWLVIFFALVLFLTGFYSDFFQAPVQVTPEFKRYRSLFSPGQILGVQRLILKNNLGTFEFEKESTTVNGRWKMTSPRNLPANNSLLNNVLQDLNSIQIRGVLQSDPINIANYSLDTSVLSVTLIDGNEKETQMQFGLINPIDNSTYVSLSDQDAIYHINNISTSLNTLDFGNFVDTRIFTFEVSEVSKVEIFKVRVNQGSPIFEANKSLLEDQITTEWQGRRGTKLNTEAVTLYLENLKGLKSQLILDKVNEELKTGLDEYLSKPAYEMKITLDNGEEFLYTISGLIKSLPSLKLERWQNYFILPSNRPFPFVMAKDSLSLFQSSERNLRKFPVKKLFY